MSTENRQFIMAPNSCQLYSPNLSVAQSCLPFFPSTIPVFNIIRPILGLRCKQFRKWGGQSQYPGSVFTYCLLRLETWILVSNLMWVEKVYFSFSLFMLYCECRGLEEGTALSVASTSSFSTLHPRPLAFSDHISFGTTETSSYTRSEVCSAFNRNK